jgi:hypothetical protein
MTSSSTYDYGMAPAENRLTSAKVQSAGITDRIQQTIGTGTSQKAGTKSMTSDSLETNLAQLSTESQVSDEDWLE